MSTSGIGSPRPTPATTGTTPRPGSNGSNAPTSGARVLYLHDAGRALRKAPTQESPTQVFTREQLRRNPAAARQVLETRLGKEHGARALRVLSDIQAWTKNAATTVEGKAGSGQEGSTPRKAQGGKSVVIAESATVHTVPSSARVTHTENAAKIDALLDDIDTIAGKRASDDGMHELDELLDELEASRNAGKDSPLKQAALKDMDELIEEAYPKPAPASGKARAIPMPKQAERAAKEAEIDALLDEVDPAKGKRPAAKAGQPSAVESELDKAVDDLMADMELDSALEDLQNEVEKKKPSSS